MAPFVLRTYKAQPSLHGFLPLSAERREEITAYLAKLNYCPEFETMDKLPREADECFYRKGSLQNGEYYSYFSAPKYVALNVAAAAAGFAIVFGLTYLLPALARHYWRWLNR